MIIKSIPETIQDLSRLVSENNYEEAYEISKDVVDLNKEYIEGEYVFKNLLEELLFQVLINKEIKKKYPLMLDYSDLYANYGKVLFHFEEFDDAKRSFELSKKYNPVNVKANMGLCEIFKRENNPDEFYRLAMESFKIAYFREDLAKSFKNLSYYFLRIAENERNIENAYENIKISICLKKMSIEFDESNDDLDELNKVLNNFDKEMVDSYENMSDADAKDFLKSKGLPYEAGIEIITICKNIGFQLDESKKVVPALFYFNIAYDLTHDEDIKLVIDDLNEKIERKRNE
ncbi:MAG: hypothetical protein IJP12_03390 [Methanobrevibacter sp.]|nr:hypothetical protein [Methanobrevibacter sp.]